MSDSHLLHGLRMSLDFADFLEGVLNEVDGSRFVFLSDSSEHSSAALRSDQLRVLDALVVANELFSVGAEVAGVFSLRPSYTGLLDLTDALITASSVH